MPGGSLLYNVNDPQAVEVAAHCRDDIRKVHMMFTVTWSTRQDVML